MSTGSLTIVGTGIQFETHLTLGAKAAIERAEKVVFVLDDAGGEAWLRALNPSAESLRALVQGGPEHRLDAYASMVEQILVMVRQGKRVCAVFAGHPGVFVSPAHDALEAARGEGFPVKLLPGITAADCLFADLGVDPGARGCQFFDATDFLLHRRRIDPSVELVLWQIGMVGNPYYRSYEPRALPLLVDLLVEHYGAEHQAVVYEAAGHLEDEPVIQHTPIPRLPEVRINERSLLYVPSRAKAPLDLQAAIGLARLGAGRGAGPR